jgi:hypothetical protein
MKAPAITSVRNPVWHDASQTLLDVDVSLDNGITFVPYTVHSQSELYDDILAGKYGPIGTRQPVLPSMDVLSAYASMVGKRTMESGISVGVAGQTVQVDTHAEAIAGISRNLQLGSLNPAQTFVWVQTPTRSINLTVAQMQVIAKAAYTYEQGCWEALADIGRKIASSAITSRAEIDAYPWPKNS